MVALKRSWRRRIGEGRSVTVCNSLIGAGYSEGIVARDSYVLLGEADVPPVNTADRRSDGLTGGSVEVLLSEGVIGVIRAAIRSAKDAVVGGDADFGNDDGFAGCGAAALHVRKARALPAGNHLGNARVGRRTYRVIGIDTDEVEQVPKENRSGLEVRRVGEGTGINSAQERD